MGTRAWASLQWTEGPQARYNRNQGLEFNAVDSRRLHSVSALGCSTIEAIAHL